MFYLAFDIYLLTRN